MFMEERHQAILKIVNESGRISIGNIQDQFNISVDSARRDLRILEEKGLLKRTHGGAIPLTQVGDIPPRVRDIQNISRGENYDQIAKQATTLVKENDIVYLTSGSVGFLMLKYLPRDFQYTLVVNSATLADQLKYWDNVNVYITGGKMRQNATTALVDSFATRFVQNMNFDISFITGAGLDAQFGFSNSTPEAASFQEAVITNSRKNVLLLPSNKVGYKAFVKVCDTPRFDILITDWEASEEHLAQIEETGVQVIVVDAPTNIKND
ncbi:MAG: DeoR/GlpR transcriptional regulator [Cellulosilyticum sp.]|nr:DeoR/GlpR transcriptional regulator [Cellulosilyticum sp.]